MRFGDYIAVVCTLVLYRHGIKGVITKIKYMVVLKDRVLALWGPSSTSG